MSLCRFFACCVSLFILMLCSNSSAQISKGNQILLNRGLQIQGLVQPDNYFHLDTFSNANYTAINFIFNSTGNLGPISTFAGSTPGFPWARWVSDEMNMPTMGVGQTGNGDSFSRTNEIPYTNQLVSIQLGDEWNLNDDTVRTRLVDWFVAVRSNWPNAILYHNNWGGQIEDAKLSDFISRAQPDMLCFDTYPWESVYDINEPNHTGAVIPGPGSAQIKNWYGFLRQDREYARAYGIPLAIYRQTFHAVQDYDGHVFRDPSPSELRLNTFAAMAFNVKSFTDFTYNTSAGSLFTKTFNGSGDSVTNSNGLYTEITDVNKRARNLGKALLRLKPIYDLHNTNTALFPNGVPPGPGSDDPNFPVGGYTTSILFIRGKSISGGVTNFSPIADSFLNDPQASVNSSLRNSLGYSWWESGKNDPYLTGFFTTNTAAVKNNGLHGDGVIAWLTPLDESMDGPAYSNQVYMLVVNGLTDPTGTSADCMQTIVLDFSNLSGSLTNLIMLDPSTGQLITNGLPAFSTKRRLSLNLNGGDAALLKFNTGAPFVGFYAQAAQLSAQSMENGPAITIRGTIGAHYQLQTTSSLSDTNWTTLTNLFLPASPYLFVDTISSPVNQRYYRAIGTP